MLAKKTRPQSIDIWPNEGHFMTRNYWAVTIVTTVTTVTAVITVTTASTVTTFTAVTTVSTHIKYSSNCSSVLCAFYNH